MRILFLLIFVFITGCATHSLVPEQIRREQIDSNTAIIIGSLSRDASRLSPNDYKFIFKNIENNKAYQIDAQPVFNIFSMYTPDDFNEDNKKGGVFIYKVPAGHYTFTSFGIYDGYIHHPTKEYSIPFEAKGGRLNYVGEIKLTLARFERRSSPNFGNEPYWEISDQRQRDLPIIFKKLGFSIPERVTVEIPKRMEIETKLVKLPE